jgi:hypothetical protein
MIEGTSWSKQQVHYKSKQRSKRMEEWIKILTIWTKEGWFEWSKQNRYIWTKQISTIWGKEKLDMIQQLNMKEQEKTTSKQGKIVTSHIFQGTWLMLFLNFNLVPSDILQMI